MWIPVVERSTACTVGELNEMVHLTAEREELIVVEKSGEGNSSSTVTDSEFRTCIRVLYTRGADLEVISNSADSLSRIPKAKE